MRSATGDPRCIPELIGMGVIAIIKRPHFDLVPEGAIYVALVDGKFIVTSRSDLTDEDVIAAVAHWYQVASSRAEKRGNRCDLCGDQIYYSADYNPIEQHGYGECVEMPANFDSPFFDELRSRGVAMMRVDA